MTNFKNLGDVFLPSKPKDLPAAAHSAEQTPKPKLRSVKKSIQVDLYKPTQIDKAVMAGRRFETEDLLASLEAQGVTPHNKFYKKTQSRVEYYRAIESFDLWAMNQDKSINLKQSQVLARLNVKKVKPNGT